MNKKRKRVKTSERTEVDAHQQKYFVKNQEKLICPKENCRAVGKLVPMGTGGSHSGSGIPLQQFNCQKCNRKARLNGCIADENERTEYERILDSMLNSAAAGMENQPKLEAFKPKRVPMESQQKLEAFEFKPKHWTAPDGSNEGKDRRGEEANGTNLQIQIQELLARLAAMEEENAKLRRLIKGKYPVETTPTQVETAKEAETTDKEVDTAGGENTKGKKAETTPIQVETARKTETTEKEMDTSDEGKKKIKKRKRCRMLQQPKQE